MRDSLHNYPSDFDLIDALSRVLAWQGRHEEAQHLGSSFPEDFLGKEILLGDLSWYRNDCHSTIKFYQKVVVNPKITAVQKKEITNRIEKCFLQAEEKKNHEPSRLQSGLNFLYIDQIESQNQREKYVKIGVLAQLKNRFYLAVNGTEISRTGEDLNQIDRIIDVEGRYFLQSRGAWRLLLQHAASHNFVYKGAAEIEYDLGITDKSELGLTLRYVNYDSQSVVVLNPSFSHYFPSWLVETRVYRSWAAISSQAASVRTSFTKYTIWPFFVLAAGNGESIRSYLTGNPQSNFLTVQAGAQYIGPLGSRMFASIERRFQESYSAFVWTLGGAWIY